ncbi:MAG: hypothetical protein LBD09_03275 [Treponema sp.]|jgi:hypothetical protein|nr:hypothetical protein [Treponema sp.]
MRAIHIANEKKRDAEVGFAAMPRRETVIMALPDGREKINVKFVKSLASLETLKEQCGGDLVKVGEALIAGDPEIDMEQTGRFIRGTHRLWMTADNKIAYRVNFMEVVHNPDGSEKERREFSRVQANIKNEEFPVQWTGRLLPIAEGIRKFVFTKSYQIRHTSGLTYDFLYAMAQELAEKKSFMLMGAGKKGNEPLRLTDGGEPYRGFLEGRVEGDTYCLVLHLTSLELKALPQAEGPAGEAEKTGGAETAGTKAAGGGPS